jgi:hypothetical protein
MQNRNQNIIGYLSIAFLFFVAINFSVSFLQNLNNGEKTMAEIVQEIKYLGQPTQNYCIEKFNIIEKIGGSRSLYCRYAFKDISEHELLVYYHCTLRKNGWKKIKDTFRKNKFRLTLDVSHKTTSLTIVSL